MQTLLIGSYPTLSANGAVALPLRSLPGKHSLQSLMLRIAFTLTDDGGASGPFSSADIDLITTTIISRLRLYGSSFGEPINCSSQNLRTIKMLSSNRDVPAYVSTTGSALIGSSLGGGAAASVVMEYSIPFTDELAATDPDWFAPCTDQLRHDGFLELLAGSLALVAVTGGNVTASAITVQLYANANDAHESYVAPLTVIREQTIASNTQSFEAGLYLNMFDTRLCIGSSAYSPTYVVEKDGKPVVQSATGESLGHAYLEHAAYPGAFDVTQRIGPILFLRRGYESADLKPSLAAHNVRVVAGFTSGTIVYRMLRAVDDSQIRAVAQFEGMGPYAASIRPVLDKSAGDGENFKISLFKPHSISPVA